MSKDAKDKTLLREYALICRVLMVFLCAGYIITVIILGMALGAKSEESIKDDPAGQQFVSESKAHFYAICCSSLISVLLCAIFITATTIGNLWMTVPYFVMHVLFILYCAILLIVEIQSIWKHYHRDITENRAESFGRHVLYHKGAGPLFCGILAITLLMFTLFPIVKFMNECRLRRIEKIQEEKQKQKRIEFQFAVPDEKAESERLEMDRETSTTPSSSAVSSRRASSMWEGQITRENSVVPTPTERVRSKTKLNHGHRKHYY